MKEKLAQLNSILYKLFFFRPASLSLTWQSQCNQPASQPTDGLAGLLDISIRHRLTRCLTLGGWLGVLVVGFSQFVDFSLRRLSPRNWMHVLMKHCWPAAYCQVHCCLDDWSIGNLALLWVHRPLWPLPRIRFPCPPTSYFSDDANLQIRITTLLATSQPNIQQLPKWVNSNFVFPVKRPRDHSLPMCQTCKNKQPYRRQFDVSRTNPSKHLPP